MIRVAILVSGRGSNMQKLVEAADQHSDKLEIVLVASNKPCDAITFAINQNIPAKIIDRAAYDSRALQEEALAAIIEEAQADWIFLAGYMAILGADFVARFANRIVNIHPSLLPAFKGLDTHERALQAQVKEHGATVHLVNAALDDGPAILQAKLAPLPDEDAPSLAARVLRLEHQLYPFVLISLAHGDLVIEGGWPNWQPKKNRKHLNDDATEQFLSTAAIWP